MTLEEDVVKAYTRAAEAARVARTDAPVPTQLDAGVARAIGQMTESLSAGAVEALKLLAGHVQDQDRRITAVEQFLQGVPGDRVVHTRNTPR
jgi:hypothetical protein